MKSLVARALAQRVKDGELIGIGSGSTVELAIEQIGQRISREGLKICGVPTSHHTALISERAGIQVISPVACPVLDWSFDGADEVDADFNLIKGRHGAMLNEKIIAKLSKKYVIIVSEEKLVNRLGERFAIPVEIMPESLHLVEAALIKLQATSVKLREATHTCGPIVSEHGNFILDVTFEEIKPELESAIKMITGVIETGLFTGIDLELLVAGQTGIKSCRRLDGGLVEEEISV